MSAYLMVVDGHCSMCGSAFVKTENGIGTGYATLHDPRGVSVCYTCADRLQRLDLLKQDTFSCYVDSSGQFISTWTGGKLGRITHWGEVHPWSRGSYHGERHYIRVTDCHGQRWYGTGCEGQWCNLKKCKS